jgi:hypothetical protein
LGNPHLFACICLPASVCPHLFARICLDVSEVTAKASSMALLLDQSRAELSAILAII